MRNALAAALCLVTLGGSPPTSEPPPPAPDGARHALAAARDGAPAASPGPHGGMFDPTPALGAEAGRGWPSAPLDPSFQAASAVVTLAPLSQPVEREADRPAPRPETAQQAHVAPLPPPRPAERRMADRPAPRRARTAAPSPGTAETPSFFEALFGARTDPGPALGYAARESGVIETPRRLLGPAPAGDAEAGAAIYDISARVVRLPSGETLEAHSGLGPRLDDPRFVHLRMRGATPPGAYDLTEREQLFHGVRALRLNPVGGSGAIHGRDGLLAHTYMLGPNGDSNGCVSFKDYNRFLQAYLRGEIRRLIVVSGRWQDGPPRLANRRIGRSGSRAGDG